MAARTRYYRDPCPAVAESFRLADLGHRVSVGRVDGLWYVRIRGATGGERP